MKRKIFGLILIAFIITGLVGCSPKSYTQNADELTVPVALESISSNVSGAKILAVGDIMFHMPQINAAKTKDGYDFYPPFKYVKKYIEEADIAIANFETVTAGKESGFSGFPKFNSPVETILGLKDAGFDILSTANNHTLDRKKDGIIKTIDAIEGYGLKNIGTYKEISRPFLIQEVNGIKIGFIAYTASVNGQDSLLPNGDSFMVNRIDEDLILSDIDRLKIEGVDVIVASMHWGFEYYKDPTAYQMELGEKMIDWGVNVVLGSHPHIIQKSEIINKEGKDNLIVYSMGNFFSNQRYETMGNPLTEDGVMVQIEIEKNHETNDTIIKNINFIPTWIHRYRNSAGIQYDILPIEEVLVDDSQSELTEKVITRIKKSANDTITTLHSESN